MFDGKGNHWLGPGKDHWDGVDRTHRCRGASATSRCCDMPHSDWVE